MNAPDLRRVLSCWIGLMAMLAVVPFVPAQSITSPDDGFAVIVARGASVSVAIAVTDGVVTSCESSAAAVATATKSDAGVTISGVGNGAATVTYAITGGAARTLAVTVVDPFVVLPSAVISNDVVVGRHATYALQTAPAGGVISAASVSSAAGVATVQDLDATTLRVDGVSVGGAGITLTILLNGSTFTHTFPVRVRQPYVTSLEEGANKNVTVGGNLPLKVFTCPNGGVITSASVSAPTVAAASFSGHNLLLTGLGAGEAIVTYQTEIDGYTATNTVVLDVAAPAAPNVQTIDLAAPVGATVGTAVELGATSNAVPPYALQYAILAGTGVLHGQTYTPLAPGTHTLRVFGDGADPYGPAFRDVTFTVGTGDPMATTIVWGAPPPVPYGQPLGSAQLNAFAVDRVGRVIPGSFVYSPTAGAVLAVGENQAVHAVFTPDDAVAFAPAEADNTIDVRLVGAGADGVAFDSNVAIGHANASASLDVTGSVGVQGDLAVSGSVSGGNSGLQLAAGGNDQNVTLTPSGHGATVLNGNVGVGTSNPTAKLDVDGDARVSGGLNVAGSLNVAGAFSAAGYTASSGDITGGASGLTLQAGGDDQNITLVPSGTGNTIVLSRLGVGTTTPETSLDVFGSARVSGNTTIGGNLEVVGTFSAANYTASTGTFTGGEAGLTLSAGGANRNVTVNPSGTGATILNGRVGVGTTSPLEKLQVNGGNIGLLSAGTYGDIWAQWITVGSRDYSSYPFHMGTNKYGLGVVWDSDGVFLGLSDEGSNRKDPVIAWGDDADNNLRFLSNGQEKVRITGDGRVGIGTTNPQLVLDVLDNSRELTFGNVNGEARLSLAGGGGAIGTIILNADGIFGAGANESSILFKDNDHNIARFQSGRDGSGLPQLRMQAGDSLNNAVVINADGAVGIGTASPTAELDVAGDANVSGNLTVGGTFSAANFGASSGVLTGGSSGLTLNAGGSNQNVTLTPSGGGATILNGNVGIGTASPSARLDVTGDAKITGELRAATLLVAGQPLNPSSLLANTGGTLAGNITLAAGTAATAPLTLRPGVNLATPVLGAVEFDGTRVFVTNNAASPTRQTLAYAATSLSGYGIADPVLLATGTYANPAWLTSLSAAKLTAGTLPASSLPAFSGDVTSSAGSAALALAPSGVTAGTYAKVTVDAKGRVTAGAALAAADISGALQFTPYNATNPAGYITAAQVPVPSVFGRTGAVVLTANDVATALGFTPVAKTGDTLAGALTATNLTASSGTVTGSSTSGLTLAAGGTDKNVAIAPSGAGNTIIGGKVGIGTNSPGSPLSVQRLGATGWNAIAEFSNAASNGRLLIAGFAVGADDDRTGLLWENQTVANVRMWMGNNQYLYSRSDADPAGSVDGRRFIQEDAAHNVGIGTTAPQKKLDVAGDANVSGDLTVGGTFTAARFGGGVLTGGASGLTLDSGAADQSISFATTGNGGVVMQRSSGKAWQRLASSAAPAFLELSGASTETNGAVANGFGAGVYLQAENNTVGNYAGIENVNQGGTTNGRIDFVNLSHAAGNAAGAIDVLAGGAVASLARVARFDATTLTLDTGSLTGGLTGLRLNAGGANQSVTLAPNGTGQVIVPLSTATFRLAPSGSATVQASSTGGLDFKSAAGAVISFSPNAAEAGRFGSGGNLLLGTTTDAGNGRLQLANHTGPAGGLGLGTDWSIYRLSPTELAFASSGALRWTMQGNGLVGNGSSSLTVGPGTAAAPSINFTGATNSGFYRGGSAADVGVSSSGVSVARFNQSNLTLFQTTASTSPTSGALIVPGGAGIGGALNVGGNATVAGQTSTATLSVTNNATVGGTLGVTGTTSTGALAVSSNATVGGALGVTGATTLAGPLVANASATLNGPTTAASLNVTSTASFQGTSTFGGTMTFASGGNTMGQILWADTPVPSTQLVAGPGRALLLGANGSAITGLAVATTGHVGVGTTAPAARLHVVGATPELRLESAAAGDSGWLSFRDAAGQKGAIRFLGASAQLTFDATGATNGFNFVNGNVGIGTTAPAARLDVTGDTKVTGRIDVSAQAAVGSLDVAGDATIDGSLGLGTAPSAGNKLEVAGNVQIGGGVTATGDGIFNGAVKVGSGANQWTLANSSGTLGFSRAGTSWLTVNATGGADFAGSVTVGGSSGIALSSSGADFNGRNIANLGSPSGSGDATSKGYVDGLVDAAVPFYWQGGRIYLKSPQNFLGLGTSSPVAPLHVGNVSADGEIARFAAPAGWSQRAYLRLGGGNDQYWWEFSAQDAGGGNAENGLAFRVRNGSGTSQPQMYLAANGNVGLGTTQPGDYKLAVNGKIHTQEVVVDTTGWSDYVFEDNYRNAPLDEVEAHIKEYKHLPGVPSAQEVAEKGVNVGQMQAVLLAKVEELTLHLIEQEKRIKRLENENAELRAAHN